MQEKPHRVLVRPTTTQAAEDENVSTIIRGIRFPRRDQSPTRAILTGRKFQLNQIFILTDSLKVFCEIKVKEDYIQLSFNISQES